MVDMRIVVTVDPFHDRVEFSVPDGVKVHRLYTRPVEGEAYLKYEIDLAPAYDTKPQAEVQRETRRFIPAPSKGWFAKWAREEGYPTGTAYKIWHDFEQDYLGLKYGDLPPRRAGKERQADFLSWYGQLVKEAEELRKKWA